MVHIVKRQSGLDLIGFTPVPQALYDGQHPSAGTGAGVPSGQILRSMVHIAKLQSGLDLIGFARVPQAVNDGQHPPAGTGAGVPSGQILRSMVQKTAAQLVLNGKIDP